MSTTRTDHRAPQPPAAEVSLRAHRLDTYHVFVASPGDVGSERLKVREFFDRYNRNYAEPRGLRFEVIDWENYSSAGVGRPQELITEQTLERYKESLAIVIGIMAQRFGSPSGKCESGTEEEFEWAITGQRDRQFPVVKWFFKDIQKLTLGTDNPENELAQWNKVKAFRKRLDEEKGVFFRSYVDLPAFEKLLEDDVAKWMARPERPWFRNFRESETGSPRFADWPEPVVADLAARLEDEFVRYMQGGESLSASQARKRYVASVVRRRSTRANLPLPKDREEESLPAEGSLEEFLSREGVRLLVIGPGGRGKTTTLRHLAAEGARRAILDPRAPICVYLSLTTFEAGDDGFKSLLNRIAVAAGLELQELSKRWQSGPRPILFLLDALNEVSRTHAESCTKALMTLLQGSHPEHRYIITARPGTDLESISANATAHLALQVVNLLEFSPAQVSAYLAAQGRVDLKSRISDQLKGLASNPFLLWAITRVFTGPTAGPGPKNRGTLFQALIDDYIFAQREMKKLDPSPTSYNFELVKKPVLAALAAQMVEDGRTNVTDGIELWTQVAERLKALRDKYANIHLLKPGTFMPPQFAAVALLSELLDNGVLVREGSDLRFMHESVQEYFAAVALRDGPVEDIAARAPLLNLAQPAARGPMFETLVTWAGLVTPARVAELARQVREGHPLLAVHLCREAALSGKFMEEAKRNFLTMTESEHEARAQVGFMGLALMELDDAVMERFIDALKRGSPGEETARRALQSKPTDHTIRALVKASLASSDPTETSAARALSDISEAEPKRVAVALVEAWRSPDADAGALTSLGVYLDTESVEGRCLAEALVSLSADAELEGDLELSRAIDALKNRMDRADRPRRFVGGLGGIIYQLNSISKTADQLVRLTKEREARLEVLGETCKAASDQELARLLDTTDIKAWRVVRAEFRRRSAPDDLPVATVVSNVTDGQEGEWFKELDALPAKLVQRELADRLGALEGNSLRRAQLFAELLADQPSMSTLKRVFSESGADLRALAAHAAARLGAQGVACLSEMLRQEKNREVIEAGIEGLGKVGNEEAVATLQDLLLSPKLRSHWWDRYTTLVRDSEEGGSISDDSWAIHIQGALLGGGAADETLRRLTANLTSGDIGLRLLSIDAAGRWQERPAATELLKRAQQNDDPEVRRRASWYLARSGDPAAWRALVESDVHTPLGFVGLAQDAARRFGEMTLDSLQEQPLIAAAESVLRPLLRSPDADLRARALNLTRRLPRRWISDAWRAEALALGESMLDSDDMASRPRAVRSIAVFAADGESRLKALLLGSADKEVRKEARGMLGDEAFQAMSIEFQRALESGDPDLALRTARALGADKLDKLEEPIVKWLGEGGVSQCVAAMTALSQQWTEYSKEEKWAKIGQQIAAAFERNGVGVVWKSYAAHLRSTPERHPQSDFTRSVIFVGLWDHPTQLRRLVSDAQEIWPEDLNMLGTGVALDIRLGHVDRAAESIEAIRKRFGDDKLSPTWLGDQYAALDRPADALEHYRRAVEQNPDDVDSHFKVGWWAFVTGDLELSIEASRRSLELRPTTPAAAFNLGLALLARGETDQAELSYRKAVALARRYGADHARKELDGALGDFTLLAKYEFAAGDAERMREWLQSEQARLDVEHSSSPEVKKG